MTEYDYNPKTKPFLALIPKSLHSIFLLLVLCFIATVYYFMTHDQEDTVVPPPIVYMPPAARFVVNEHVIVLSRWQTSSSHDGRLAIPADKFEPWKPFANSHTSTPFESFNCPAFPVAGYPKAYSMLKIIENWNPDDTAVPRHHYSALCHFDGSNQTQLDYAYNYRAAEVPFVVHSVAAVDEVVKRWSDPAYLRKLLGNTRYRTETSDTNHFMYWSKGSKAFLNTAVGKTWKAPTGTTSVTFNEWLDFATKNQNKSLDVRDHQYFRVSSNSKSELLFKELPFFLPKKSLFIVDPSGQRGIHCRFGMRSVIAEAHFDSGRNAIVLFGGMRRYILTHPSQCKNMHMLPKKHPSGRHSDVDWSAPDIEKFPNFAKVEGNEEIMTPGRFLYLPQDWIHYIISLNVNYQCNTRSGFSPKYQQDLRDCGF